jgi:hypothetical protein
MTLKQVHTTAHPNSLLAMTLKQGHPTAHPNSLLAMTLKQEERNITPLARKSSSRLN